VCDLETLRIGALYMYDISILRVNFPSPLPVLSRSKSDLYRNIIQTFLFYDTENILRLL
jgi:hypothetical protein